MPYKGAEAIISERRSTDINSTTIIKERIIKNYRLPQIDAKLRKQRTKSEASLIREAARAGVNVPRIIEENEFSLELENISGKMVKDVIDESNAEEICKKIGMEVALLHKSGIIHGDLTTSNMIVKENELTAKPSFQLYLIDFGLGFRSQKPEDMATDLHVLSEALVSTHFFLAKDAWKILLKAYSQNYGESEKVVSSLNNIEKRGRYRDRSG